MFTRPKATGEGSFHSVDIEIILLLGKTELQAQLEWKENVSRLQVHMLFNPTDIGLTLRVVFREYRNGKF